MSVEVKFHHDHSGFSCAVVTGISALPLEAQTGAELTLEGHGSSAGDYAAWTGEGGEFLAPDQRRTVFVCDAPGLHTLTFEQASSHCKRSRASVEVECLAP